MRLTEPQARWQVAVELYRDEFLSDFYLPDSSNFEDWVLARRAALRRQCMDALDILIATQMDQETYPLAEAFARRQLAINNLHEPAHRRLIEILVHLGRRTQALSHFEAYRSLLQNELGVEPAAESVRFIAQVRGEARAARAIAAAPSVSGPGSDHNLPPQPTQFIGREQALRDLAALALGRYRRLINIVGPGGIGKSRLALAHAER